MNVALQTIEAARQAGLLLLRNRLLLLLVGLGLLAAVAVGLMPHRMFRSQQGEDLFGLPAYWLLFQFALPLAGTYFALNAVHGDLVDGSVAHVFAAPVPRSAVLLGRWLASSIVITASAALVLSAYWLALSLPGHDWRSGFAPQRSTLLTFLCGAALAAPAYAAVGVLFAAWFKRPLIAAVVFVVGWEVAVSNLPPEAGVRGLTIADPVRRFLADHVETHEGSHLVRVLEATLRHHDASRLREPLPSVLLFGLVALTAAVLVYASKEYRLRSHGDE